MASASAELKYEEPSLTFDDLKFLHQNNIVLRNQALDKAKKEQEIGGHGDFISLATFAAPLQAKELYPLALELKLIESKETEIFQDTYYVKSLLELIFNKLLCDEIPDTLKESLLKKFIEDVKHHIQMGIFCGTGVPAILLGQKETAKFPLTLYHPVDPLDKNFEITGYPLGKFGSYSFNSKEIVALVSREDIVVRPATDDSNVANEYIRKTTDLLFQELIKEIKKLRHAALPKPKAPLAELPGIGLTMFRLRKSLKPDVVNVAGARPSFQI